MIRIQLLLPGRFKKERTSYPLFTPDLDRPSVLAQRLRIGGYEVSCYDRGESSVDTSRKTVPDLIIMDIGLPGISGLEAFKRIRVAGGVKQIPILFLSACHDKETYCREVLKADGFLQKTCNSSLILSTMVATLAQNYASSLA